MADLNAKPVLIAFDAVELPEEAEPSLTMHVVGAPTRALEVAHDLANKILGSHGAWEFASLIFEKPADGDLFSWLLIVEASSR